MSTRPPVEHETARGSSQRNDHLTFRGNTRNGRFGWLRLTPAYSLQLVRDILSACSPGDLVLDPFSGTGTTALSSSVSGIHAHAVDVNPFLVWLGNLKLRRFTPGEVEALRQTARAVAAEPALRSDPGAPWTPKLHQIEKWWDPPELFELARLFARLDSADASVPAKDLLRVAFCRALIEHAHVSFGHQSMSFRKRRDGSSPRELFPLDGASAADRVRGSFLAAAESIAADVLDDPPRAPAAVFLGDARALECVLPGERYTAVVTSPPYPNRMSYIRELRPYMYWLGFLADGRAAGELDWQAIGGTWGCATSNLASWTPDGGARVPHPRFERIVASIRKDHELLGRYVHKYFEDIQRHIVSLKRALAPRARCFYVVGNSKFYGTLLPVEELYAALLEDAGFDGVRTEVIRKRSSKKELFEFVVQATAP